MTQNNVYNSRIVESSQTVEHSALEETVRKHLAHDFRKPVSEHTREAFHRVEEAIHRSGCPVVLDTGCGTGESTVRLAELHPGTLVVGIDKSAHRLYRSAAHTGNGGNYILVRADLVDFWRLTAEANWPVYKQYLLYPNPWPKPDHLMRRWHGHPVFGSILATGGDMELRSNWRVYVEEFAKAYAIATGVQESPEDFSPVEYISPFERKYALSGQNLYRFVAQQCNNVFPKKL